MSLTYGFLLPNGLENSQEFSEAIHALFGNGVTKYGGRYGLTLGGSFKVNLSTGYAISNGRYIKHDEPFSLTFPPSNNTGDRYDAISARADYLGRIGEIAVLVDIDPQEPIRNEREYNAILYIVRIRRGATILRAEDVQDTRADIDLCGYIVPLSDISGDVEYVYKFTQSGIEETVRRILEKIQEIVDKANQDIAALNKAIQAAGGLEIGELRIARRAPTPLDEWLLCDGMAVPEEYPGLSEMVNGRLPDISRMGDRYRVYIYGGRPEKMNTAYFDINIDTGMLTMTTQDGYTGPDYRIIDGYLEEIGYG